MSRMTWRTRVVAGAVAATAATAGLVLAAAPASAGSLPCSYGSATSIRCPAITWTYQGHEDPWVMFLDHTPSGYPVKSVVNDWNSVTGIDSAYRWYTDGGLREAHNVHVYAANIGGSGVGGETRYNSGAGNFNEGVVITINTSAPSGSRRAAICHEVGHVLGLGHSSSTSSCMYGNFLGSNHPTTFNDDDRALLGRLYP